MFSIFADIALQVMPQLFPIALFARRTRAYLRAAGRGKAFLDFLFN